MESLSEFGDHFQAKLIHSILLDKQFAEQIIEIIDLNSIDIKHHKDILRLITDHYTKYNAVPTVETVETLIADIEDDVSKKQAKIFISSFKESVLKDKFEDIAFVKDKSLDFCRKQNLKKALLKAAEMLNYAKYDEIIEIVKQSVLLGFDKNIGLEYFDKDCFNNRMREDMIKAIPSPWPPVNKILNCGLGFGAKELHVFLACVTRGKSHLLVQCGAEAIKRGFKVAHYTLELSELKTALRYDSNFSDIAFDEVKKFKNIVWDRINQYSKNRLVIKEYPTKSASCGTIRNHLSKMKLQGFIPDMIIIDYADLMKPATSKKEKRFELESVYEDLRGLAVDYDVPILTASQATRDAADAEIITMESIAEAYLKAAVSDTIISLSRTISDIAHGMGRFYVPKNRSGVSGMIYNVEVDTSKSKITTMGDEPVILQKTSVQKVWDGIKKNK
jgi:replicative DNA helicase